MLFRSAAHYISLFPSTLPLNTFHSTVPKPTTSLCSILPSHSTHSTQLYHSPLHFSVPLYPPTQHTPLNCNTAYYISLFHSTLPLNTFHSTVPQPTTSLFSTLPSHSTLSTELYHSPLHCRYNLAPLISHNIPFLPLTSCRLPPASLLSQFPLSLCTPNCTWP